MSSSVLQAAGGTRMRLRSLSMVLVAKIALTVAAWCIPLLFFPAALLETLGFPVPQPELFLRLLGMAYTALVVGYGFGLYASVRGEYPLGVVWVGIVSNGGAFAILCAAAVLGVWASWGVFAQVVMWGSLVGTGGITAGLVAFGPCRSVVGVDRPSPRSAAA